MNMGKLALLSPFHSIQQATETAFFVY